MCVCVCVDLGSIVGITKPKEQKAIYNFSFLVRMRTSGHFMGKMVVTVTGRTVNKRQDKQVLEQVEMKN